MEASNTILSLQFPPRAQPKRFPPPTALMLHEQAAPALSPTLTTSLAPQHSTSVIIHELRDDFKPLVHINKTTQAVLNGRHMETEFSANEENDPVETEKYLQEFQRQLLHWQGLWYLSPSLQMGRIPSLSATKQSLTSNTKKLMSVESSDVVVLAKKALSASKQAVSLAVDHQSFEAGIDESLAPSLGSTPRVKQDRIVKSTRLLERRSKKRRESKGQALVKAPNYKKADLQRSKIKPSDPDDALRLFSWVPETKQLLNANEESELIGHIQELMRLEEVKGHLHVQFGREPTLVEWAEAVGLSSRALKLQLHNSSNSREKLIYANFRLVVHIAKQYQGRGLNLHDLLQEGSMGLMVSVHKFKPQVGCRFATYAYWWIRQAVRKAIFQHCRTIRLPDNVYSLLNKVTEAKRQCIQEGNHSPTKEQIAVRAGLTVDKLERLLYSTRTPLSMQQPVWTDQNTTFQQITADTTVETPKSSVEKQLMRRHVRNLLSVLSPRERTIMRLRYGIEDGVAKSLSDIGAIFGLSKERIRQLENRSLYKLRQRLGSEGLDAYEDLLIKL